VARATQLLYSLPSCRVSGSVRLGCQLAFTMSAETTCYTVVYDDNSGDAPSTQELREGLQKGSDDVKFDTLRRIIVSTINGNPQVGLYVLMNAVYLTMWVCSSRNYSCQSFNT
jgi:hypothetical protein